MDLGGGGGGDDDFSGPFSCGFGGGAGCSSIVEGGILLLIGGGAIRAIEGPLVIAKGLAWSTTAATAGIVFLAATDVAAVGFFESAASFVSPAISCPC